MPAVYRSIAFQIAVLCILSIATGLTYNALTPRGLPLLYQKISIKTENDLPAGQAYLVYRTGTAVFIDTRSEREFSAAHIRNAVNLPAASTKNEIMAFMQILDKTEVIVVYCSNRKCNSARQMTGFIRHLGFINTYVFADGFEIWNQLGYPVEF